MAQHALIDGYLGELRRELRRLPDAEDIVSEVADHLLEGVGRRRERGLSLVVAQQSVLTEFGNPMLVSRAFASSKHGGIAVPTTFTKRAGLLGIISAVLYVGAMFAKIVDNATNDAGDWDALWWKVSFYLFPAAGILLVALVVGLNRRHGGALGGKGRGAIFVLGAAALASLPWPFLWGPWLTLLLVGTLLLLTGLRESGLAPLWAGNAMVAGSALTAATMWIQWFVVDGTLFFGEDAVWFVAAGILTFAAGVYGIGHWLFSETPVDEPSNLLTV